MRRKKRTLLINPKFQLNFIGWMMYIGTLVILIIYIANYYFFKSYLDFAKTMGLPADHVFFSFLKNQFNFMNSIFLVTALITFLFIFLAGCVLSHRIAGPIYRLSEHMKNAENQTHPPNIKFRSTDYFNEVGEAYNNLLNKIFKKDP